MSRRVLVLGLLAVGLAALLLLPEPSRIDSTSHWSLPTLAELTRIKITRTGAPDVELVRGVDGWKADSAALDAVALEALKTALNTPTTADASRTVDAENLADYGVGEHAITVTLSGDGPPITVRIGKVVDGRRTFVLDPKLQTRVYRATKNLRTPFERPAPTWRDRRLYNHTYNEVAQVRSWVDGRLDWAATRSDPGSAWRLTVPAGSADSKAVASVVNSMVSAQAESFERKMVPVKRRLELVTFSGDKLGLEVGDPGEDGSVVARVAARDLIVRLPAHLATFLRFDPSAVRESRVFPVEFDRIKEVLVSGMANYRLVREEGAWHLDQDGVETPLNESEARQKVGRFTVLRAAGEASAPAATFDTPFLRVVVRTLNDEQWALVVGAVFNQTARFAKSHDPQRPPFVLSGASLLSLLTP